VTFLIGIAPTLLLIWCCMRFFRAPGGASVWTDLQRGIGWQALWVFPALLGQVVYGVARYGFDLLAFPATLVFGWWVLLGGASVQAVFEETAKSLTGHRRDTMVDNGNYHIALTATQAILVGLFVAWRLRKSRLGRDPLAVLAGLAVLVNAALGITWPWWGT
jgi:hypothetical protein